MHFVPCHKDHKMISGTPTKVKPQGPCPHQVYRIVQEPPESPHFGRRVCASCGKFAGWEPNPDPVARARNFKMFFGCHRGQRLGHLLTVDPDYVRWLAETFPADKRPGYARTARFAAFLLNPQEVNRG